MYELSLFSGGGGGLLATVHLLGWQPVGYVEIDDYCQRLLAARIADGVLPEAPIFGNIKAFAAQYAEKYRGVVGVVTAGFPCQPFSVAGKRRAGGDDRNLWPETIRVIRTVRPRFCFLENVAGLLAGSHGYFGTILGDLAEAGYDARWCVLGADDVGAPHRRKRLWILADASRDVLPKQAPGWPERERAREGGESLADADHGEGTLQPQGGEREERRWPGDGRPSPGWWDTDPADDPESGVGRVAHGVAHRVDRLRALGNGQVPAVAAAAWEMLTNHNGSSEPRE